MLGLREEGELEEVLDKRDYGTWLHGVLHQFHTERLQGAEAPGDMAQAADHLERAAAAQLTALRLPEAEFLPYWASFQRFVPAYLQWLAAQQEAGWSFMQGEVDKQCQPWPQDDVLHQVALKGRLDRIDQKGAALQLIDYKTGSVSGLKARVAEPLEDTQLAVYGVLMRDAGRPMEAIYLALEDSKGPQVVAHDDVARSSEFLVEGLAADLRAMHEGQALPALGEGAACSYCQVRGLCRKDDGWEGVV